MSNQVNGHVSIQVMDSLGEGRGGLTKAVFDRMRLIARNQRTILATVSYQPGIRAVFERLQDQGAIPESVELRSFHEDSRNTRIVGSKTHPAFKMWNSDPNIMAVEDGSLIDRYYIDGKFLGLVAKNRNGTINFVDVHDQNRPWMLQYREKLWNQQSLAVREYLDEAGSPRYRIYYNEDGVPYLSTWVTPGKYEYRTTYWPHAPTDTLEDARGANKVWLDQLIDKFDSTVVYFDEPRTSFAAAIERPECKIIATIHTTHRIEAADPPLKRWTKHYMSHQRNIDKFVVLTELQRQHLIKDFDVNERRVLVIPHSAPDVVDPSQGEGYDNNLLVIVSRLAKEKRIDQAIRAFSRITVENPQARLEIFGTGPEEGRLKAVISELGISNRVVLKGRSEEPLQVFRGACASVITSEYEGLGLVILESMSQGTPVIGYRSLYGPADIVDESNGTLVENNDVVALAEAMAHVLRDLDYRGQLHDGALKTAARYSQRAWEESWQAAGSTAGDVCSDD